MSVNMAFRLASKLCVMNANSQKAKVYVLSALAYENHWVSYLRYSLAGLQPNQQCSIRISRLGSERLRPFDRLLCNV